MLAELGKNSVMRHIWKSSHETEHGEDFIAHARAQCHKASSLVHLYYQNGWHGVPGWAKENGSQNRYSTAYSIALRDWKFTPSANCNRSANENEIQRSSEESKEISRELGQASSSPYHRFPNPGFIRKTKLKYFVQLMIDLEWPRISGVFASLKGLHLETSKL